MARFRKKSIVIEAYQMTAIGFADTAAWPAWLQAAFEKTPGEPGALQWSSGFDRGRSLQVQTLEGPLNISQDDWIIQGIKGELYPCKPDIFAEIYEEEPAPPPPAEGEVVNG